MAKKPGTNFASLGENMIADSSKSSKPAPEEKATITSFALDTEHRVPLLRVAYSMGAKGSQRRVINEALAFYFANHPKAKIAATRPTPDEEGD